MAEVTLTSGYGTGLTNKQKQTNIQKKTYKS